MKRAVIFAVLLLSLGLSSCQCADKPDIGPVEGEDEEEAAVHSVSPPGPGLPV